MPERDLSHIPREWLEEFEAAARRPLKQRMRYAFIKTYKPVMDDADFRAFDTTADYRRWCEENLPSWLGYGRGSSERYTHMTTLAQAIFRAIEKMQNEAKPTAAGESTGLRGYCDFANPARADKRNIVENLWSERIASLLPAEFSASCQYPYPRSTRRRCDIVAISRNERTWIEVKGSWRQEVWPEGPTTNANFKKYIAAAASDLDKL